MKIFASMAVSGSALTAEKLRIDVIAANIANQNTTGSQDGSGPYQPRRVVFREILGNQVSGNRVGMGVRAQQIVVSDQPPLLAYQPEHPDADESGYVALPNIDIAAEMVDLIGATRSYEANVTVLNASKTMALKALEIGR